MYGNVAGVQALVPAAGSFGGSSTPTEAQVVIWLEQASARIDRALATAGYATPVASSATAHAELSGLANLYSAAYVLSARGLDSANGEAENRSDVYLKRFDDELKNLGESNLTALGISSASTTTHSRRRVRTLQLRRIDGYSDNALDDGWTE